MRVEVLRAAGAGLSCLAKGQQWCLLLCLLRVLLKVLLGGQECCGRLAVAVWGMRLSRWGEGVWVWTLGLEG